MSPARPLPRALAAREPAAIRAVSVRLLGVAAVLVIAGIDAALPSVTSLAGTALMDESAHALTSLVAVLGLAGMRLRPDRTFAACLMIAGCVIDADHIPQYLGATVLTTGPGTRPVTHTLVVALALAGAAALTRAGRVRSGLLGAAAGVAVHLARDAAGSGTAVLWPLSTRYLELPYGAYLAGLAACALAWARWPERIRPRARVLLPPSLRVSAWVTGFATAATCAAMISLAWSRLAGYQLAGFDTGIFVQGIWLLSTGQDPFVTVRGLGLFADHASFVLLALAPLYALAPDPRMLLALQVIGVMGAAPLLHAIFARTGRPWPALVFPLAYLCYPPAQYAAMFEWHPESLAPVLLTAGLYLALARRRPWWVLPILAALACKEDVGIVVAGLGALLIALGQRRRGAAMAGLGLAYALIVVTLVMPALSPGGSIYLGKLFGIPPGAGPAEALGHLPDLAGAAFANATSERGLLYLALILAPLLGLPAAAPRWLLPAAGPIAFNLASQVEAQQEITFHYLATASPFLVAAAFAGYARLAGTARTRARGALLAATLTAALVLSVAQGPLPAMSDERSKITAAQVSQIEQGLSHIPDDASVSASWNLVPALAQRTRVYEFPVPFDKGWWGAGDPPAQVGVELQYVVVRPGSLRGMDRSAWQRVQRARTWKTVYANSEIAVVRHTTTTTAPATGQNASPAPGPPATPARDPSPGGTASPPPAPAR